MRTQSLLLCVRGDGVLCGLVQRAALAQIAPLQPDRDGTDGKRWACGHSAYRRSHSAVAESLRNKPTALSRLMLSPHLGRDRMGQVGDNVPAPGRSLIESLDESLSVSHLTRPATVCVGGLFPALCWSLCCPSTRLGGCWNTRWMKSYSGDKQKKGNVTNRFDHANLTATPVQEWLSALLIRMVV